MSIPPFSLLWDTQKIFFQCHSSLLLVCLICLPCLALCKNLVTQNPCPKKSNLICFCLCFIKRSDNFRMNLWSYCFSQNTNKKLSRFLPSLHRAEILTFFHSYFGSNDGLINSLLTKYNYRPFCDWLKFLCHYLSPDLTFLALELTTYLHNH